MPAPSALSALGSVVRRCHLPHPHSPPLPTLPRSGTHIPAHGWLNACRICGSWTSRTRPIQGAHLSVPLCSGCAERIDKVRVHEAMTHGYS